MTARRRRRLPRVAVCLFVALASPPLTADTAGGAQFVYDAFLSGAPVGTAHVIVSRSETGYRIAGTASAQGVAHLFSDWRTTFQAIGHFEQGLPELLSYAYDERERKKQRVLKLTDGIVRNVKNGQVRAAHQALAGTDVLTAFFMDPGCWDDRLLHTGRYNYRIQGRPSRQRDGCDFLITDDDGESTRVYVRFANLDGHQVPAVVNTRGLLRASIRLRRPSQAVRTAGASGT